MLILQLILDTDVRQLSRCLVVKIEQRIVKIVILAASIFGYVT